MAKYSIKGNSKIMYHYPKIQMSSPVIQAFFPGDILISVNTNDWHVGHVIRVA